LLDGVYKYGSPIEFSTATESYPAKSQEEGKTLKPLNKGKVKFVMHCYSGSKEMALEFIKLGGYISLGGPVTFKNSKEPKEVAKVVPLDKLLIETDCPYLAPHPYRGKRNEPSYVRLVLSEIAKLREMDELELEQILDNNSISFFNLD
jgi:TatD DNase family protein